MVFIINSLGLVTQILPPHWRAEQARTIIYKPYASTEFTLNQYNEFAGGSIVFSSNSVCICALYRIKKKKKNLCLIKKKYINQI